MAYSGERIRMHRERAGLSQEGLARRVVSISQSDISKAENGRGMYLGPARLSRLASALGVEPSELI